MTALTADCIIQPGNHVAWARSACDLEKGKACMEAVVPSITADSTCQDRGRRTRLVGAMGDVDLTFSHQHVASRGAPKCSGIVASILLDNSLV